MTVSNSTPFISFARINRLDILEAVLGEVLIPQAVYEELVKPGRSGARDVEIAQWIQSQSIPNPDFLKQVSKDLGEGEREAIALAKANNTIFLSDDSDARKEAKKHDVEISGSLAILQQAKDLGLIPSIKPILDEMMHTGYRLSPALYRACLGEAGEL